MSDKRANSASNLKRSVPMIGVMRFLMLGVAAMTGASGQTAIADQNSSLAGTLVDQYGVAIHGAVVTISRAGGTRLAQPFLPRTTISDSYGVFTFSKIPSGVYRICPAMPGSAYLNPCEWFDDSPTTVLKVSQVTVGLRVVMTTGCLLSVRIDDPASALAPSSQGQPTNSVSVMVLSPRGMHPPHVSGAVGSGQNFLWSVPAGLALQLSVSSPTLNVVGQGNADTVNAAHVGQAQVGTVGATASTFQLSTPGASQEFRYTVQGNGK